MTSPLEKDDEDLSAKAKAELEALLLGREPVCIVAKSCGGGGGGCDDDPIFCEEQELYDIPEYAPPEWDAILSASVKNDALEIRRLIEQEGIPPSHSNAVQQSALHLAALWGNVEAVRELLKFKAPVNAQNTMSGATPLHAIMMNRKGATPNLVKCIDLLLANGANPNIKDYYEKTPAEWYTGDDQTKILVLKLQPQPLLFRAIENGDTNGVQQILQDPEYRKRPFEELFGGKTAFAFCLDIILEKKREPREVTYLWRLVKILKMMMLEGEQNPDSNFLIEAQIGQDVANDEPPIHRVCAALQSCYEGERHENEVVGLETLCKILIPLWPKNTDKKLIQMFHSACRRNDMKSGRLFLEVLEMDPNVQGQSGMTGLHFAARSGAANMVRYLLASSQIDVTVVDSFGKTAMDAARANGREGVLDLLDEFYRANGFMVPNAELEEQGGQGEESRAQ